MFAVFQIAYQVFFFWFIYLCLCWVFVSARGLSLVVASWGHSSSRCVGLSLSRPLLLQSTGSRCASSVIVAHGPSRSAACGIFPDQGWNPCPLLWQADSQPLRHQGSPRNTIPSILHGTFCLILITILWHKYNYYLHFTGQETVALYSETTRPHSFSCLRIRTKSNFLPVSLLPYSSKWDIRRL